MPGAAAAAAAAAAVRARAAALVVLAQARWAAPRQQQPRAAARKLSSAAIRTRRLLPPTSAAAAAPAPPALAPWSSRRRGLSTQQAEDAPCCGVPGCQHRQPHTHGKDGIPCWACGRPTGCCTFFCACGKIQPVVGDCSYFETFHIPRGYNIDAKELEQAFFKLQKSLHPDHYGQSSKTEQDFSRSNSTYLNVAYRTLKDPTLRAKYLLQLEGIPALDEKSKTADPALLMEIMELREQIEEGGDAQALKRLMGANREAMEAVKRELAAAYGAREWERMVALTNRLQYLSKADTEARERLDQLEG